MSQNLCIFFEFCALTYRNVTPHFDNLKYRRIPYNIIIKVTEFIRIDIVLCQSQPLFFDSPFSNADSHSMFKEIILCSQKYMQASKRKQALNIITASKNTCNQESQWIHFIVFLIMNETTLVYL